MIVDIDNTIANIDHRLKYIINKDGSDRKKKDWDNFFKGMINDKERTEVTYIINSIWNFFHIVFVTGRPEKHRPVTEAWIEKVFGEFPSRYIYMRPDGDRRDDDIVKKELTKDLKDVAYIFEDRPRVIRMYREQFPEAIIVDCGNANHFKKERMCIN